MANIQVFKRLSKGRTHIRVAVTPKSPETRALLRKFQAGVKDFEKSWKATKAYQDASKAKKKKAARREAENEVVATVTINQDLDTHQLETIQLQLRALARSCGLEVSGIEVETSNRG